MTRPKCRFCSLELEHVFADLGLSPLANSFLRPEQAPESEKVFPLRAYVCSNCLLVQLEEFESPEEIFGEYAYFSSYADSWLEHCRTYTKQMIERLSLGPESRVVEVASNDGYLLQYFHKERIPVLGIEPAANVARVASEKGIPTRVDFFSSELAGQLVSEGVSADLLLGNNVLAHVPDLNDFVAGLAALLAPAGVITMEFPHLMRLMAESQFDTIYHEHFSYFSLATVRRVFAHHGLDLFDVEELVTHGGSLRIYACHEGASDATENIGELLRREAAAGLTKIGTYLDFDKKIQHTKNELQRFLTGLKERGLSIVGYGAPAKGNTLLNFCGIGTDLLDYTVDRNPHKQGLLLPGTRIPICAPEKIYETRPDYVFILPWNLKDEILGDMSDVRDWGGRFFVAVPEVKVY